MEVWSSGPEQAARGVEGLHAEPVVPRGPEAVLRQQAEGQAVDGVHRLRRKAWREADAARRKHAGRDGDDRAARTQRAPFALDHDARPIPAQMCHRVVQPDRQSLRQPCHERSDALRWQQVRAFQVDGDIILQGDQRELGGVDLRSQPMRDGLVPAPALRHHLRHRAVRHLRRLDDRRLEGVAGAAVLRHLRAIGEVVPEMQVPPAHRVVVDVLADEARQRILVGLVQPGGAMVEGRAEHARGMGAAADAIAGLQHHAAFPRRDQRPRGGNPGAARADDHHVWIIPQHHRIMPFEFSLTCKERPCCNPLPPNPACARTRSTRPP
jgi:hypothetical protein